MPIYIYRGGPGPGPRNPLMRFLVSLAILAGVVALGIFLLPVIGVMALIVLGIIAVVVVGGVIYRWLYGDPWQQARQKQSGVEINPGFRRSEPRREAKPMPDRLRNRFHRDEKIEDAVVVEETKKSSPDHRD